MVRTHLEPAGPVHVGEPRLPRGRHQVDNAITALRLLEELDVHGLAPVKASAIRTALTDVVWPARLELVHWRGHDVLIDGAHNPAGARALASYVSETFGERVPFVVGVMKDKRIDDILAAIAPVASHVTCTTAASDRAASPATLMETMHRLAPEVAVDATLTPMEALKRAASLGNPVVVAGSLYLAGEIRHAIV